MWNGEERIAETPRECYLRLYGTIESVVFFAFHVFVTRRPERLQVTPREAGGLDAFRARYPQERQGGALDWDGVLRETLQLSMGVLRRVRREQGEGWDFVIEV